ncbi:hypothetical protein FRC09_017778 [Ceratobasidium sp. 395]|nr:hypothetical protein FRC09_017778 [Ceratobasidium sp. 395]
MLGKRSRTSHPTNNRRTRTKENLRQPPPDDADASWNTPDMPGHEMNKNARVWRTYNEEADGWDKEMVERRNGFIIESLKDLKPDPAETSSQTLLAILQKLDAPVDERIMSLPQQADTASSVFQPPRTAVVVNLLWILSLSLSVGVSLIAMLAKDWFHKFMYGRSGQPYDRARRRQKRWNGMKNWRMRGFLTHLSIALHASLLLFAAGLCVRLWETDKRIALPVVVISASATLIYILMTVLPLFFDNCPYKTPATDSPITKGLVYLGVLTFRFLWVGLGIVAVVVPELVLVLVIAALLLVETAVLLALAAVLVALFLAFGIIYVMCWLGYEAICWLERRWRRYRAETRTLQAELIPRSNISLHPEVSSQPAPPSPPASLAEGGTTEAPPGAGLSKAVLPFIDDRAKKLPRELFRATMGFARHMANTALTAGRWLYRSKRLTNITENLLDNSDPRASEVLMDSVTSDMLAWILAESQDIKSIDIALQAVSGASSLLPLEHLALPQTIDLVATQLSYFGRLSEGQCKEKEITTLSKALTYCRAYKILALDGEPQQPWDRWQSSNTQQDSTDVMEFMNLYLKLLDALRRNTSSNQDLDFAAAITAMPFCHWGHNTDVDPPAKLETAPMIISSLLRDCLAADNSESTLCLLVDSTAHYLIGLLPRRRLQFEHSLPTLLVQVFLSTRNSYPEVAYSAVTILSATAFALNPYPGGETPSQSVDSREQRAFQVLTHYKNKQSNVSETTEPESGSSLRQAQKVQADDTDASKLKTAEMNALFTFGLLGVLHDINFEYLGADIDNLSRSFQEVTEGSVVFNSPNQPRTNIHTLPTNISLEECVISAAYRCLLAGPNPQDTPGSVPSNIQRSFELFLWPNIGDGRADPRLYLPALSTLCHSGFEEVWNYCTDIITHQPIPANPLVHLVSSSDSKNILTRLCCSLRDTNSHMAPLVLWNFRLLIAHIMLASDIPLPDRKTALLPLLDCVSYSQELQLNHQEVNGRVPDEKSILRHVKKSEGEFGPNSLLRTMRFVFRFCHATSDASSDVVPVWQERLNELREYFQAKNATGVLQSAEHPSLVWDNTWAPLSADTLYINGAHPSFTTI